MMQIRPSRPDDRDRLFAIWRDAVQATHGFLSPADFAFFTTMVRDQYLPAADVWCAVDERDLPVGFLGMTGSNIDTLFIAPDRHRQGIGRALLQHAYNLAPELTLDVNEQNEPAVRFYQQFGFETVGRSETDDTGRPYPLLRMALRKAQ